jgi:hypothetical protein
VPCGWGSRLRAFAATNSAYPGTCCCMGQARVSKVAEREVDGLTRLAERPFHVI